MIREQFFGKKGNIEEMTPRAVIKDTLPLSQEQ